MDLSGGADSMSGYTLRRLKQVGWPEETTPKKVIVPKGSVAFTHFDVYHRGTRRNPELPDDAQTRLMVKFWFVRCRDNASPSWDHQPAADDADLADLRRQRCPPRGRRRRGREREAPRAPRRHEDAQDHHLR